jgi:hypothetical protein
MFLETGEKLNTINKIIALSIGNWSATFVFGSIFLLLLVLILVFKNKLFLTFKKLNSRTVLAVLLVLCWAPLFFDGWFSSWQSIFRQNRNWRSPTAVKTEERLCSIDKNQNLGRSVCSLVPFAKEVEAAVPDQTKVALSSGGYFSLFLQYYFIPKYQMTTPELADYWIMYLPDFGYQINNNQELIEIKQDKEKNWGRWQVVRFLGAGMIILKRL